MLVFLLRLILLKVNINLTVSPREITTCQALNPKIMLIQHKVSSHISSSLSSSCLKAAQERVS